MVLFSVSGKKTPFEEFLSSKSTFRLRETMVQLTYHFLVPWNMPPMLIITTKSSLVNNSTFRQLTQFHNIKAAYKISVSLSRNSSQIKMMGTLIIALLLNVAFSQAFSIQPRILNGIISNPADYSYFVNVEHEQMSCGGAVIGDR